MVGIHGRHGVVEKKQLGVGNKVWIGKRRCCLGSKYGIIEFDKLEFCRGS